jgi:4-hydroxybenzoate polyprenyltransferase
MPDIRVLIKISRPRFWLYILGPYLVGLAAGSVVAQDLIRFDVLLFGLFFLLPANLLVYGINDVFDFETDSRNPKKAEYEMLLRPAAHRSVLRWIAFLNIPFVVAAYFLAPQTLPSLAGFIFFSVFYSAPPIRAKATPIVDSLFNILYVFPAAFAHQLTKGSFPPLVVMAAAGFWTMAMHAFSAIPDIDADRKAGVNTIATLLGKNGTLAFCFAAYIGAASLSYIYFGIWVLVPLAVYLAMIGLSWVSNSENGVFSIYRWFPIVNAIIGFALFWFVAGPKFL